MDKLCQDENIELSVLLMDFNADQLSA